MLFARKAPQKRLGATVVEFAITAPVFFVMVLGIVEIGRALMVTHLLNNAARRGCRIGIIPGASTDAIKTNVYSTLTNMGVNGDTATVLINEGNTDASGAQSGDGHMPFAIVAVHGRAAQNFRRKILGGVRRSLHRLPAWLAHAHVVDIELLRSGTVAEHQLAIVLHSGLTLDVDHHGVLHRSASLVFVVHAGGELLNHGGFLRGAAGLFRLALRYPGQAYRKT